MIVVFLLLIIFILYRQVSFIIIKYYINKLVERTNFYKLSSILEPKNILAIDAGYSTRMLLILYIIDYT